MFGRRRRARAREAITGYQYPKHWRKDAPVGIDWDQVDARVTPLDTGALAELDQFDASTRSLIAGFGLDVNSRREMSAVAAGMLVVDQVVLMSHIDDDAKEDIGIAIAWLLRSMKPLVGED